MTDIDIDQIRRTSQQLERPATHYDGCAKDHFGCAVLALIERLEKSEAQRDRLADALADVMRDLSDRVATAFYSHPSPEVRRYFTDRDNDEFFVLPIGNGVLTKAESALSAITGENKTDE